MSNDRAQPGSCNTRHGNSTPDPLPPDALHKYELTIKGTKFMVWNLVFRMHIPKATVFSTDDVAAAMKAINEALDLAYQDQFFLVKSQSNQIHAPNTVQEANSFKMEEYVTSKIPMKESTKLSPLLRCFQFVSPQLSQKKVPSTFSLTILSLWACCDPPLQIAWHMQCPL